MKLYLTGHDYRYAAEQMLLTLFPGERPEYAAAPPEPGEAALWLALSRGAVWTTAAARLHWQGQTLRRACRVPTADLTGPLETDRALSRLVKQAFYRAATELLGARPPWGALTGVRPVKLPVRAMERGATPAAASAMLKQVYDVSPARRALAMDCASASLAAKHALAPDELSLYLGIPFCPTRCAYCSFISSGVDGALRLVEPFLDALLLEIEVAGELFARGGKRVKTLYMGGGTPTTLTAQQLARVLDALARHIDLSHCVEYTVEAGRPDTVTAEKMAVLARFGVTRASVNPQSMHDEVLRAMGRAHRADEIAPAYAAVRAAGIASVNMDLIAGLPRDSAVGFRASLDQVLAFGPENITVHTLALKRGARLMEEGGDLPGGAEVSDMLEYAWRTLRAAGYRPYYLYRQKFTSGGFENVGWSLPGQECLYNICMMEELHTVLSLGAGGMTKLIAPAAGSLRRVANPKYPREYIDRISSILDEKRALPL